MKCIIKGCESNATKGKNFCKLHKKEIDSFIEYEDI